MVSGNEAFQEGAQNEACPDQPQLWEVADDIIKLVGNGNYYWAGIALCDLRERLKNGE